MLGPRRLLCKPLLGQPGAGAHHSGLPAGWEVRGPQARLACARSGRPSCGLQPPSFHCPARVLLTCTQVARCQALLTCCVAEILSSSSPPCPARHADRGCRERARAGHSVQCADAQSSAWWPVTRAGRHPALLPAGQATAEQATRSAARNMLRALHSIRLERSRDQRLARGGLMDCS